jgi:hypothetical protein
MREAKQAIEEKAGVPWAKTLIWIELDIERRECTITMAE